MTDRNKGENTIAPTKGPASQIERFREAARQLGCDEDEAAFDEKLKAIARQRPKPVKDANGVS